MTNQSKPHHPDGDGLPLEVRIQTARYAFFRLLRADAPHARLREEWSNLETLLDSPTPDAAEGAREHPNLKAGMAGLRAASQFADRATQKPAPDAVRLSEQERHAIGHARYQVENATSENPDCCFDYELVNTLLQVIDRTAPVPSPDGTGEKRVKLSLVIEALESAANDARQKNISGFDALTGIAILLKRDNPTLPPSATGVAEPDFETAALALGFRKRHQDGKWWHPNQQHFVKHHDTAGEIFDWYFEQGWGKKLAAEPVATPQQVQEACAQVADRAAQQDEEYAAKYPDEAHKFDQRAHRAKTIAASIRALIPPVATPPVRGDREIGPDLAKAINDLSDYADDLDATERPASGEYDVTKDIRSVCQALIDALTVHVQSGAGDELAKIKNLNQPPQSSSEGGR